MYIFKGSRLWQVLPFTLPPAEKMCLFPYTQDSINFCIHFCLSFPFPWEFLRNFQNQRTRPVLLTLQYMAETLVSPAFFWAEWYPEDGPTGLHQTLPPWGQWEAQHDCPVFQHVSGDWGEPWGSCLHPTEIDWVSALGWAEVTAAPPGQCCWPGKVLRAKPGKSPWD